MKLEVKWNSEQLWKGCILAGIAHAIMVAKYPSIDNEHSWDGCNYSIQDSAGQRGTISFVDGFCIAAFRNDNSKRVSDFMNFNAYFNGASEEVVKLALEETLQYLLEEVGENTVPVITTAFRTFVN